MLSREGVDDKDLVFGDCGVRVCVAGRTPSAHRREAAGAEGKNQQRKLQEAVEDLVGDMEFGV